jgi:anion-transporting  ArsA/GET3 family ATPase
LSLLDRKLILIVGKGGVGRSTMASAIAAACAKRGRKTLLYQSQAADRVGDYFGKPPLGTSPSELAPGLWGVNTSPAAALREYGLMILKFQKVYELIFENRITRAFLRAIPGLDDYAVLGKAWFATTEQHKGRPAWDTIVFDMPASGHSLTMLRIPWVILETVPEGPLTRDARSVQALLRDPARTAIVMVTLAEEMPAQEARELTGKLGALGIQPQRVLVNQVATEHLPPGSPGAKVVGALETVAIEPPLDAIVAQAGMARARRALNEHYLKEIALSIPAPSHAVPYLARPRLGPAEMQALSKLVESALA